MGSPNMMLLCPTVSILARWLQTVRLIKVKFISSSPAECIWRRMQINDQQAERQKKNILQKALSFTGRARELMVQDSSQYLIHSYS